MRTRSDHLRKTTLFLVSKKKQKKKIVCSIYVEYLYGFWVKTPIYNWEHRTTIPEYIHFIIINSSRKAKPFSWKYAFHYQFSRWILMGHSTDTDEWFCLDVPQLKREKKCLVDREWIFILNQLSCRLSMKENHTCMHGSFSEFVCVYAVPQGTTRWQKSTFLLSVSTLCSIMLLSLWLQCHYINIYTHTHTTFNMLNN